MPPNLPRGMAFQIYQAWLQGPSALFRLFEDSFGRQALYGPPDPDMQQREIDDLSEQIGRLQARVERLGAEVGELQGHNLRLQRRNAELEALLAKDSHNSSRPPSTDPLWAKRTRSLRRPSGKRPGGQAGHVGETLRLSERPNRVVEHRPRQCRGCHASLDSARVIGHRRQQVVEVVPARLRVTEHRLAVVRCRACGKTTRGEFAGSVRLGIQYGPGVKARVLYLRQYQFLPYARTAEAMRDLFGCRLSAGDGGQNREGVRGGALRDRAEDQAGVAALTRHPRRRDGAAGRGAAALRARGEQRAADALHSSHREGADGDGGGGRAAPVPRDVRA